jgi:hypothetical protein
MIHLRQQISHSIYPVHSQGHIGALATADIMYFSSLYQRSPRFSLDNLSVSSGRTFDYNQFDYRACGFLVPPVAPLKFTMHHCLEITEILHNIFNSFDIYAARRNFLDFALVSKAFREPALDVLRKFQMSLLALVKTFPADVWKEEGNPSTLVSVLSVSLQVI